MKIKKFKARNFHEALRLVKQELSEHAVILASEEKKGLRPYVEVTAAIDYDFHNARHASPQRSNLFGANLAGMDSAGPGDPGGIGSHSHEFKHLSSAVSVKREKVSQSISELTRVMNQSLQDQALNCDETNCGRHLPLKKKIILNYLRERSIREEYALRLCEAAHELDDVPSLLSADLRVATHDIFNPTRTPQQTSVSGAKALMFIGPTGVGKTTTIAKLAARAMKDGKRVAIISLDTYRIGAIEQIRIYANIMGIPLSVVANSKELKSSISKFAATKDIIFIDTSGRNPRDKEHLNEIQNYFPIGVPFELHLLMSANYDDEFMTESFRSYGTLPIDYLSITKVDESVRFGSLYNFYLICQRPVAFLTTGQKVPDDIESASVERLVNLILNKRYCAC